MTGLEIPGFIIGITTLTCVFDKACEIWRTIAEARNFGENVVQLLEKLEMEVFLFMNWWKALQQYTRSDTQALTQSLTRDSYKELHPSFEGSALINTFSDRIEHRILSAMSSFVENLLGVHTILQNNGCSSQISSQRALKIGLDKSTDTLRVLEVETKQRKDLANWLNKSIPWIQRIKYDARPWKTSDRKKMEELLQHGIIHWNRKLHDLLTIMQTGSHNVALRLEIPEPYFGSRELANVEFTATLFDYWKRSILMKVIERKIAIGIGQDYEDIALARIDSCDFDFLNGNLIDNDETESHSQFAFVEYTDPHSGKTSNLLYEGYPYSAITGDNETCLAARTRLARLAYMFRCLTSENAPYLRTFGFTDSEVEEKFGFLFSLPPQTSTNIPPLSLFELLHEQCSPAKKAYLPRSFPSLDNRIRLASILAQAKYTFMLTGWSHESFRSKNIFFLAQLTNGGSCTYNLECPYYMGYYAIRQNTESELSYSAQMDQLGLYRHPNLSHKPQRKPCIPLRRQEFYAFGLLLVEIGFWTTLDTLSTGMGGDRKNLREFRKLIIDHCEMKLSFVAGERFAEATLLCLKAGFEEEGAIDDNLTDFYREVVLRLTNLVPSK